MRLKSLAPRPRRREDVIAYMMRLGTVLPRLGELDQLVDRPLSMREVPGSKPGFSTFCFLKELAELRDAYAQPAAALKAVQSALQPVPMPYPPSPPPSRNVARGFDKLLFVKVRTFRAFPLWLLVFVR